MAPCHDQLPASRNPCFIALGDRLALEWRQDQPSCLTNEVLDFMVQALCNLLFDRSMVIGLNAEMAKAVVVANNSP